MTYPFKNLVFEGGGMKGICYVGAVDVLTQKGIMDNIEKVGGSSAGAIASTLVGLGYTNTQLNKILYEIDFMSFLDIGSSAGELDLFSRLFSQYGLAKGDTFLKWIENLIVEAGFHKDLTFKELHDAVQSGAGKAKNRKYRDVYLTGANPSTRQTEIYSHETTPAMRVADAARISLSIPFILIAKPNLDGDLCVDGGMLCNYPIRMFDFDLAAKPYTNRPGQRVNSETLGFRLSEGTINTLPTPGKRKVDSVLDYLIALLNCYNAFQSSIHLNGDDWARTVHIDCKGVSTMYYNMKDDVKKMLEESGREGALAYFEWYDREHDKR
ncbi:esterase [Leminorella grimontii]|uniref:Esterase n=1 Tax=Leminorella grimontii TaxID=82981 RepID=A0AAV5N179_9GAMM|nr:patatin-like phospholipase family protein [Leminorella grimontii]KFC97365.1 putative transmembrane protein [Leminorella grimontii ATCC 33999 = DSM 5078]GKX55280.1 esterase [Leminorella grimontii]GKX58695.1 esterase [Leminorella grimontii]